MDKAHPISFATKIRGVISSAASWAKIVLATVSVAVGLKLFVVEAFRIPSASMERTLAVGDFILVNKLAYALQTPRSTPFTDIALPHLSWNILGTIHRGDVVVFVLDGQRRDVPQAHLVKRVVGTPGDRVELRAGSFLVNGRSEKLPKEGIPPHDGLQLHEQQWEVPRAGQTAHLSMENFFRWRPLIEQEGHTVSLADEGTILIDGNPESRYTVKENYYFVLGDHREASNDSRVWGFVPEKDIVGEALFIYWSLDIEADQDGFVGKISSVRWDRIGNLIR
jgi:signal peptidase I